jgi:hypothetical protein
MLDWYASHSADIESAFQQILYFNGFLLISAFMYVVYDIGLWEIGLRRHGGIVRKDADVGQFPPGYFQMLAVQLLPLTVTGFVRHDVFVIATRLVTLATVLLVYGISSSRDGTFDKLWYRLWLLFWLSASVMGPMVYVESITLQDFVENHEKTIAYSSVVAMIFFVIYGQRVAATTLFQHFVSGNYSLKRLSLQIVRFFGFALQAIHYGYVFGWKDPIFLQGLIGVIGVFGVVVSAIFGLVRGAARRRERRSEHRLEKLLESRPR